MITKEWLEEQYLNLDKSANQIAQEFGFNPVTIFKWINRFNIPHKHTMARFQPKMLIDPTKAKRIEVQDRKKRFVFDCLGCGIEISLSHAALYESTGKCRKCCNRQRPYQYLYGALKAGARSRNRECNITYDEYVSLIKNKKCTYCEQELNLAEYSAEATGIRYSLDRKDNQVGYTVENCVPCCTFCNFLRQDKLSHDEMLLLKKGLKDVMLSRNQLKEKS